MKFFITFTFVILTLSSVICVKLDEVYSWKELEYAWPSDLARQDAIQNNRYIIKNNLPLGLDIWQDKLFITVPRWKAGVASSLNYVKITNDGNKSPVLIPYPSWELNSLPGEVGPIEETGSDRLHAKKAEKSDVGLAHNGTIISTFRIRVDECDRLWVMDTGLADILGNPKQIAPNALVIFDLKTDTLIRRFTFPDDQVKEKSFFANVIVDTASHDCDNAFAYVPDLGGYGVVVYSFKDNKSWRVKHNFFHFDPLNGDYNIGGVNFQWTDGVFGMALDQRQPDGTRNVFFHALSSTKEFVVPNKVLQNEVYSQSTDSYYEFRLVGERGHNSQSSAEFLDENTNIMFYTQVNKDAVGCWNIRKPFNPDNQGLVDSDSDSLVFPNDLKVSRDGVLWVLSDRMPVFIYKQLNPNEYNYRILRKPVLDAIRGTPCEL